MRAARLLICLMVGTQPVLGQLSPGPLIEAHAHLEGIANCTKCHTLGQKVSNQKCLDCHDRIADLVESGRGYHASPEVVRQDCYACHSDHHGRTFDVIRFDIQRFDHNLTGYALTGAHAALDCRECHNAQHIADPELSRRNETYLGLETACISCHTDQHQGTLSRDCASCHTTAAFAPATGFTHAETAFPLRGKHTEVACLDCHPMEVRNGRDFQKFADIPFNQCSSCHADPHESRFGPDCRSCHTEESFFIFRGQANFDHSTTGFPLRGQHRRIDCADCHRLGSGTERAFTDFTGRDVNNCATCHDDVHTGKFGPDCRQCHSEQSFFEITGGLGSIDHSLTDFPLEGKHQEIVDCRACHAPRLTEPVAFQQCTDCHSDYHEGQFVDVKQQVIDCAACHTVDGFPGSTYTIAQHNDGPFPLTGAHLATPCFACHVQDDRWVFQDLGTACLDCHQSPHGDGLDPRYDPDPTCTGCHSTESWSQIAFSHAQTGFALEGAHLTASCIACHEPDPTVADLRVLPFSGLGQDCAGCHQDVHQAQFIRDGVTDCAQCHSPAGWRPSTFDHDSARFVLEGAHVGVDCASCHRQVTRQGVTYTLYQTGLLRCTDCHR